MKKFLSTFTVVASSFASQYAGAAVAPTAETPDSGKIATSADQAGSNRVAVNRGGDIFEFVLSRSKDTGVLMADHYSHRSHSSHASHHSHYSGR
ncbi:His-Xaa-Ser repeat protein HxsA2 [Methylosinus sp. Ce-a6]|uniref:His-Xaa-Ser repeat protein HxsA2 n=1 Tax=Methylosinus sp. Ce-a6 TaxID=2172005 RepID=UPI001AED1D31|nr:His-Xaa-Ser repeat protein HxsA2 [Methylosinus sp. Ce-a6]